MKNFSSSIGVYFGMRGIVGRGNFETLSSIIAKKNFFDRDRILYSLKEFNFSVSEMQDFLSMAFEDVLIDPKSHPQKADKFLEAFKNDLNDFSINKAVLTALCWNDHESEDQINNLLVLGRNLNINPETLESFELVSEHARQRLNPELAGSAEATKCSLKSIQLMSEKFKVDLKDFKDFFKEMVTQYEKSNHFNSANVLKKFIS